ncbi:hypothetical protein H0H93_001287 [Arthromyces matolae]|nr:hypothetical protein H0H93_001287 [Arthromyces matolae]
MSEDLVPLLQRLQVPVEYGQPQYMSEDSPVARLQEWKSSVYLTLTEIELVLKRRRSDLSTADQANVISTAAFFDSEDIWVVPSARKQAKVILQHFDDPPQPLLSQILNHNVKPLFQHNPHPQLNASGRKLARPAGGPMATHDFYDSQKWKTAPGVANIVSWCVKHMQRDWYEALWPLIVPPVMALLDDFETRHKLCGVRIVSEMLREVPGPLLKRTGVDGLIRASLNTCLAYLNENDTPLLIAAAVDVYLTLTLLTTSVGSAEQFDQLCFLLGEGIIRGIWLYASEKPEVIHASLKALPPVLRALNIGTARFFKVECGPCVSRWKITILDAIARCWVTLIDSGDSYLWYRLLLCPVPATMSISMDDLVNSLSASHVGQDASDLAALQAHLAKTLFASSVAHSSNSQRVSRKTSFSQPCNTPTYSNLSQFSDSQAASAAAGPSWMVVDSMREDVDEDERMVEDLLVPRSPSTSALQFTLPLSSWSKTHYPSSIQPSDSVSSFTSTDPFYLAQVQAQHQNSSTYSQFTELGKLPQQSPFAAATSARRDQSSANTSTGPPSLENHPFFAAASAVFDY